MNFNAYFSQLIDWKKLPAYKLETRIDSFIGYYLSDILKEYTKQNILAIIPEFPLRVGTLYPKININKSFKVDFLAISESGKHYLIEFKTDSNSRRLKQDDYLNMAKQKKLTALIDGLKKIFDATDVEYKQKYLHLKNKLLNIKIIDANINFIGNNEELEIIYIQPSNTKGEKNIIDFEYIIKFLKQFDSQGSFEHELIRALEEWKNN
ncbi:hypothetical protein FACS1894110_15700 [Spirochaetia bacterium]|nr:hypothetical protein FACS1894110_15700 [Spirochaetia bacterium]